MNRRVVITGIGAVSPNGVGCDTFARACREGRSGISPLRIDTTGLRSTVAAAVHDFDPMTVMDSVELRRVPRMIPMALHASREALVQAGLLINREPSGSAAGPSIDPALVRKI